MSTTAWMLRNDGQAFECVQHIYCMEDADLSSEAEAASFIYVTDSKDKQLAMNVLDAWAALQLEETATYDLDADTIDSWLAACIAHAPYTFMVPISGSDLVAIHTELNTYHDIDSLYQYCDYIRDHITEFQEPIKRSLNQQFCRVRYGGQYNSSQGNNGIWFRISSTGFNWDNVIYTFAATARRSYHVDRITICRDHESDNGFASEAPEYFYKAKDGSIYYDMPIDEYFSEEHGTSPVFASTIDLNGGLWYSIKKAFSQGFTYNDVADALITSGVSWPGRVWPRLVEQERHKCVCASDWSKSAPTKTQRKLDRVGIMIQQMFPEISYVEDYDLEARENTAGNPVGFELTFVLASKYSEISGLEVSIRSNKPLSQTNIPTLVNMFATEYSDYKRFKHIEF